MQFHPITSFHVIFHRDLDSLLVVLMLDWLLLIKPNPFLPLLPPPAHTMRYAVDTTQHRGPVYCEDTRPGQQWEAARKQHANLSNIISAKAVTLCIIFLDVGGTCCTEQPGLDHQRAIKLAQTSCPAPYPREGNPS
eukprot:1152954-Pelagomonas_calceolata.AAC.3